MARIYVVESEDTVSLVRADTASKALRHVVKNYNVRTATAEDVAKFMGMGATVEDAGSEPGEVASGVEAAAEEQ